MPRSQRTRQMIVAEASPVGLLSTMDEVGYFLTVARRTVQFWTRAGQPRARKVGRGYCVEAKGLADLCGMRRERMLDCLGHSALSNRSHAIEPARVGTRGWFSRAPHRRMPGSAIVRHGATDAVDATHVLNIHTLWLVASSYRLL